ncbi:hypothetical protein RchiOBHm_Chr1g0379491 [Rosa chinensis]|uniref:Reticulon-like protein n=1 Tax=Rosa chinensis TaxID=74649 RepID=A0A2P6SNM9_ROSCH|nr:reticulon-like protein B5 [Rosa chinensis]PRQ60280.1 hypothetical protein RchiOBHm_Chr1g0379491 [Rosa chinensis]
MAEPEEIPGASLMEKIYSHHRSSSSSSSSDDDKPSKKADAVKPDDVKHKAEEHDMPSAHDSVKSNKFRIFGREKPVHKVLGGGKPADVLLWRDKKVSGSVLGGATVLWIFFELLEYHLITLVCHMLILSLGVFFLWSNVSSFINKAPPEIPKVQIPEKCVLDLASALRIELNKGFHVLREIASGRDLRTFLIVIVVLWILSVIGKWFNFLTLFYLSFVLLHTVPVIYEKHDVQIDAFAEKAWIEIKKQYAVFDANVLSKIPKGPVKEKKKD